MSQDFITVMLDKPRRLRYSLGAEYRMGTLDRPFALADISRPRKGVAAVIAWAWAMLHEKADRDAFATPEDLVAVLKMDNIGDIAKGVTDAILLEVEPGEAKNAGAAPPPSPASSSA